MTGSHEKAMHELRSRVDEGVRGSLEMKARWLSVIDIDDAG
jgi:hypothetical protein